MIISRIGRVACLVLATFVLVAGTAHADVPVGEAHYVPCPGVTGNAQRYLGQSAPYRCHSAVVDPIGDVVVLRQGGFTGTSSAFGYLHALLDHNVDDHVIERVISSAYPLTAPQNRIRYIAELRVEGHGVMSVWVEVDRKRSNRAPDPEPHGVVTAYCKLPANADPENKCPDWVNDSLLP
jgi:hypothetical protein